MENIVLITGASKGIGKALAEVFAKNGYSLILIARTTSELEALQKQLQQQYQSQVKILSVDLSQPDCADVIVQTFKDEMPNIEILVNNAGYGIMSKFGETKEEDVDGILAVNIHALTKLTYKILPFMVNKKRGKILNVASTAAYLPGPYMALYYASKAYVLSFSQAIDEEYREDGISISALCPGVTNTSFQARAHMEDALLFKMFPNMTAEQVADIAYHGLMKKKRVIITGFLNKLIVIFLSLTPNFINTKVTGMLEKPKK